VALFTGTTSSLVRSTLWVVWALLAASVGAVACERPGRASDRRAISNLPAANQQVAASAANGDPAAQPDELSDARIDWNANRVMRALGKMSENMTVTEYSHGFRVSERDGVYVFDCSGFADWLLGKAAPKARAAVRFGLERRPVARDFQRRLAALPADKERYGWRRVGRVADVEPGDVVAWLKPDIIQSPNTGHVAFVVHRPMPVPGYGNAFLVRVADSTSLLHDDDTRVGRSGFGLGTILLVADPDTGAPIAYGWVALRWRTFETPIAIGRPLN